MKNKFNEFLTLNLNQFIERVDPTNKNQCFDLAIAWCEWLGLPINIFSGLLYAYQIYTNPTQITKDNFSIIPNTPDGVPQVGDIVVFSNKFGSAGHVVIATGEGDIDTFKAFSQNDPIGSPCVVKTYNYDFVLGWLRFKDNELQACLKAHKEAVESADKKDEVISKQSTELLNVREERDEAVGQVKDDAEKLLKLEELRDKWHRSYEQANTNYETCKTDRATFQKQLTEIENKLTPKNKYTLKIYKWLMGLDQVLKKNE
jgi:hypothetical protein